MEKERKIYRYEGPVMQFGKVINDLWKFGTQAVSEKQALSNLAFRYKMKKQLAKDAKIELDANCLRIVQ